MKEMSVSIIIPTYNRSHLLPTTIPFYVQKFVIEIIVIDDNSSDDTETVVKELMNKYPIIRYFRSEKKIRQTGAKNIGIKMATGDYCYFGDDDSVLKKDSISSLVKNALNNKNTLIASRHIYMDKSHDLNDLLIDRDVILDHNIDIFYNKNTMKLYTYPKAPTLVELPFCQACFLIPTALAKSQLYYEKFVGTCNREETDYIMQLCLKGYRVLLDCNSLSIDLPQSKTTGGIRSVGFLLRHLGEAYNEYIFYTRNRVYLKKISNLTPNPIFRAFMHLLKKIIK